MANFVHKSSQIEETQSSNLASLFHKRNKDAQVNQDKDAFKLENKVANKKLIKFPFIKVRLPLQAVLGLAVLLLLVVGAVSAMFLTTLNQDVRQQAKGCTYWNGGDASEGSTNNRGGIVQKCVNGYWSSPNADSSTGGSSVASGNTSGSSSACGTGEIFCGGCISACRPANDTCNTQIDNECKQTGCGGNGVFPGAGEQCCSGLQQCVNGRCGTSCSLDSNPVCGGIREGSNCNNGGKWTCDSTNDGGSGHCEGGIWNQPSETRPARISCDLGGHIVYFEKQSGCDKAKKAAVESTAIIGGIADVATGVINTFERILDTVSSTRTSTHTEKCNLSGNIVYVADESICNHWGGNLIASTGGSCIPGEAVQCIGGTKFECLNESWINQGPCLKTDSFSSFSLCSEARTSGFECWKDGSVYVLREALIIEVTPVEGGDCISGEGAQCIDGEMLDCKNESWSMVGVGCGVDGNGDWINSTCYYLGGNNVCTPSTKFLRPGESCKSVGSGFTSIGTCDDLRSELGIVDQEIPCYYKTSTSCNAMDVQVRPGESCGDAGPQFYTSSTCGLDDTEVITCYLSGSCDGIPTEVAIGKDCSFHPNYSNDSACDEETLLEGPQVEGEPDSNYFIWTEPESWGWNVLNLLNWRWNAPEVEVVEETNYKCHEINSGQCYSYNSEKPCSENEYSSSLKDGDCPAVSNTRIEDITGNEIIPIFESTTVNCYYDFGPGGCLKASQELSDGESCSDYPMGDIPGQNTDPCN